MEQLTIFTPTYNRKNKLTALYNSLLAQTNHDFLWLIVDDGSRDQTDTLVSSWICEQKLKIQYVYQPNGGKCAALKCGIGLCSTPWFICVDSDDTLTETAVQDMLQDINTQPEESYIGFIYPRRMNNASPNWIPKNTPPLDIPDLKLRYGIQETAILLRTPILKSINIPSFEGETFLSEELIYISLSEKGRILPKNNPFYLCVYQKDGLTRNLFKNWIKNPKGTLFMLQHRYRFCKRYPFAIRVREHIKCILNLNAVCLSVNIPIGKNTPDKILSILLFFPSLIWKILRFS